MNRGARRQISQTLRPLHVRRANEPAYPRYPQEEIKDPQQDKTEFIVLPEDYEPNSHYLQ